MVIMINPNTADTVNFDMTTMLVLNNVSRLGFGSVNIVNLYSRIMEKLNLRFNGDDELIDDDSDAVIEQYAAMSDAIIIAWGTIGKNTLRVRERQKYLLELIKQHAGKITRSERMPAAHSRRQSEENGCWNPMKWRRQNDKSNKSQRN